MAFCVPCGKAVEVEIRVEERPELQTDRSATTIRSKRGEHTYSKTTYRTKWIKHKIAVCTECGKDVEFPDADTAEEALQQHEERSDSAMFKSIMWLTWPTLAAAAAMFLLLDETLKLHGWLSFGAWIAGTLVVPPLVGYGCSVLVVAFVPRRLVDVTAVGMRTTGFSLLLVMTFAFFAWAAAPFIEKGTEETAAMIAGGLTAAGCVVWLAVRIRHVLWVRSRLTALAGGFANAEEATASDGGQGARRRFKVPGQGG